MTKLENVEQLKSLLEENQKLKQELLNSQKYQHELERRLTQIQNAKSYKLWQKINKIKNKFQDKK